MYGLSGISYKFKTNYMIHECEICHCLKTTKDISLSIVNKFRFIICKKCAGAFLKSIRATKHVAMH